MRGRGALSAWLSKSEIKGILSRREKMQKEIDKQVAEKGAAYVFVR